MPKISLKVDINRYLLRSNPILEGQIEAKLVLMLFDRENFLKFCKRYTYGKGADGIVNINLKENYYVTSDVPKEEIVFSYKVFSHIFFF